MPKYANEGKLKKMKKIVTVIAVCLASVIMAESDVQASAIKATTEKNIVESTFIDEEEGEEHIATGYIDQLGNSSGKKVVKTTKNNKNNKNSKRKSKNTKNKKTKNKTSKKTIINSELSEFDNSSTIFTDAGQFQEAMKDSSNTVNTDNISAIAVSEKKKQVEKNKKNIYTPAELKYMTCIIYCEARGEKYAGQMAVGIVVMNRVKSDEFPDTIKKVIYQRGQFTPTVNGSMRRALSLYEKYDDKGKFKGEMVSCYRAAKEVLSGTTTIRVDGKEKEMKKYLYFSRYISGAKYTLGCHQFK